MITISSHITVTKYPLCVSVTKYPLCVSVTKYPLCVSVTKYPLCMSVTKYPLCVSVTKDGEFHSAGRVGKLGHDYIIVLLFICRLLREKDGLPYLTRLSRSRQHTTKVVFAANKVRTSISHNHISVIVNGIVSISLPLMKLSKRFTQNIQILLFDKKLFNILTHSFPSLRLEFVYMLYLMWWPTSLDLPF